ncbi:hypothetical protein INS49_001917 [Diaporthe citri]|uniref:uncharacterized protein n=1 Tax=Diaporthe citri TaxID=83186 RepID=UPI001C7FFD2E|nr:uncharacterized protein INS49_001917 [Diaporthe citri]KAG6367722.1 hypothetical protein INS49_001917 [Diaporthe citri]
MIYAGQREINVCTRELADEVCDETRFHKLVASGVLTLRQVVEDALFTAHHGSRQWGITHRILKPIFGPLKIRGMFDDMKDVAEQLCLKWARDGPNASIDIAFDYTRLTLDTIAICLMDYRFNSFYLGGKHHPFVKHMVDILAEADIQSMLPDWAGIFRLRAMLKFKKDIKLMHALCRSMVEFRRQNPVDRDDFLNAMLKTPDPETGEKLNDEEVVRNLITFLVAGHETTSGMLSFATFYLLEHPGTLHKLQDEVDRVVGEDSITLQHIQNMPYMDAVFREALRLMPTAVAFYVTPYKDEIIGGKYLVHPGEAICLLLDPIHRDKAVWGDDADEWKPERMMQDKFDALPPNSWKPFGNGSRICLGMAFSWQEAKLALAIILQNFNLSKDDPNYTLKIKHLLTIKPDGFKIRAELRHGRNATSFHRSLRSESLKSTKEAAAPGTAVLQHQGRPMTILYGSDTGTCEALAKHFKAEASTRGFSPSISTMNMALKELPPGQPVIFILGTYHGKAASNAAQFLEWIQSEEPGQLKDVEYAVYGVGESDINQTLIKGHSDWTQTFYKVPEFLDTQLEKLGAKRLSPMGRANTAKDDVFDSLETWLAGQLWPTLSAGEEPQSDGIQTDTRLKVTVGEQPPRNHTPRKGFHAAVVTETRLLSSPGVAQKRHIELQLPAEISYEAGDHLHVLPTNDLSIVKRALSCFALKGNTVVTIHPGSASCPPPGHIPTNTPLTALELFSSYFDLRRAASTRQIDLLIDTAVGEETKQSLREVLTDNKNTASILDLLDRFEPGEVPLPLSSFLLMLSPMLPRVYSFSSSPRWKPGHGTLTYSVVDRAAAGPNKGVASNHLASREPGSIVYVSLPANQALSLFRLPAPELKTPVIMIGAGTGLAPFRGFIQERAWFIKNNEGGSGHLSPALLFFGCRGSSLDDLYRGELDSMEKDSVVGVRRAYSREQEEGGCRYVADTVKSHVEEIVQLWDRGARLYICGAKSMSDGVFSVLSPVLFEADRTVGRTDEASVDGWFRALPRDRYLVEIFN